MALLEVACFNAESAKIAQASGADRIEFCHDYESGGLTPDFDMLARLKTEISIPVFVMIRPRSGGFGYSDAEFDRMKSDIKRFQNLADGFVFGVLTSNLEVDTHRNSELVALTDLPCTFHRAFDEVADVHKALEDIISCGFQTILTSGGKGSATDNIETLANLVRDSAGRIAIMPGGGVRATNLQGLKATTATWFHTAALTQSTAMADASEIKKLKQILS